MPTVRADYPAIGHKAATYMLSRGFRTFGFIARVGDKTADFNLRGIQDALGPYGCDCHILQSEVPRELHEWERLYESINQWLTELPLPIAVIASDHIVARHFVDHCLKNGLLVPDDVAVVSCQESALVCGGIEPELTALNTGLEEIGETAVEMLAALISGAELDTVSRTVRTAVSINERRSTDVHAVDDRIVARALRYIWDHSHQPMSVVDVARSVGVTRRRLERRFREVIRQSVNAKIVESRLDRAKRILADSDEPIKFVAAAAGFSSSARMAQVFVQHLSITPTDFRAASSAAPR